MTAYADMSHDELARALESAMEDYAQFKAKGLSLNMARGKPSAEQLDLSMPMLTTVATAEDCIAEDGTDCRNYGVLDGLPEAKKLMASMLDDEPENVIIGGNSSLTLMYNAVARCLDFGTLGSTPWSRYESVKWLCPVPGYDRHFGITEAFGIEMIPVEMNEDGPDMDAVEKLVASDESIKGIWCVPKYSNPGGVTYSNDVVSRLASMKCAASDFRIFWDNAYCVHTFKGEGDRLLNIFDALEEAGAADLVYEFGSTAKVTFPSSGMAYMTASPADMAEVRAAFASMRVSPEKISQLAHVRFLKDAAGVRAHMEKHAAIVAPRFALVEEKLTAGLADLGVATWTHPCGGYFVSFDGPEGSAKAIVSLAAELGVKLTPAGATWPYGKDPKDTNIRIAPTFPTLEELGQALDVFVVAVKLVSARLAAEAR